MDKVLLLGTKTRGKANAGLTVSTTASRQTTDWKRADVFIYSLHRKPIYQLVVLIPGQSKVMVPHAKK